MALSKEARRASFGSSVCADWMAETSYWASDCAGGGPCLAKVVEFECIFGTGIKIRSIILQAVLGNKNLMVFHVRGVQVSDDNLIGMTLQ